MTIRDNFKFDGSTDYSNTSLQEKLETEIYNSSNSRLTKDNLKSNSRGAWSESKMGSRYVSSTQRR